MTEQKFIQTVLTYSLYEVVNFNEKKQPYHHSFLFKMCLLRYVYFSKCPMNVDSS